MLGAAALAIPSAAIVSSAVAADGDSGSSSTQQQAPSGYPGVPAQAQDENAPDGRDCPREEGSGSGGSSESSGSAPSADTAV